MFEAVAIAHGGRGCSLFRGPDQVYRDVPYGQILAPHLVAMTRDELPVDPSEISMVEIRDFRSAKSPRRFEVHGRLPDPPKVTMRDMKREQEHRHRAVRARLAGGTK